MYKVRYVKSKTFSLETLRWRNNKINVLYIADFVSLSSKKGDMVHVKEFLKVLSKKKLRVSLIIRGQKTPNYSKISILNLPDWKFRMSFSSCILFLFTHILSFSMCVIKILTDRPSFVYQRDNGINFGVVAAKIFHVPVILELNGDILLDNPSFNETLIRWVIEKAIRFTYSKADLVIMPSHGQISIFKSYKCRPKNFFVVPNGVDPVKFHPIETNLCRKAVGLDESPLFLGFIGSLSPEQGVENAIIGFSKFLKEEQAQDVKFIIVGEGPLMKKLKELTSNLQLDDFVLFLGCVPHENVPCIINACDVCIAPFTAWRNKKIGVSPLKLYEYLSCGKPVIASAIPGTEIIKELDAGILVEPDNPEALKEAYKEAIKKLPYWKKKAHAIHKEIATKHSWDNRVETILKIIHQISHK